MCYELGVVLLTSREQHGQSLTNTVAMRVLCEATDALVFGITQERAHCVLTHRAHTTVIGSQNTFINVWKKEQININSMSHLTNQNNSHFIQWSGVKICCQLSELQSELSAC